MNASSYKTVFSKRLGALVAVGEHATSQGKANGASGPGASGASEGAVSALAGIGYVAALSASFAFVSLAWAAPATTALPTGGTVVQGAASMSQTANQLNITQSSQRAAINWQSFNIGAAATVNVAQPNAQAVLLNRVVGQSPSQIFGQLQANGHVILVNPNGVLFGKDGSVNAGGFTASTLNISDTNFMAGNMVYERNGSTAGIVNQGKISTEPGGYVALLGATVSNEGNIKTQGGSVVMGAGETIKVPVSGTGRIKLELTPAAINASLSNTGSIVTEGGQVYMQALALNRAAAQILQSGSIDTTGEKGGDVHVLADGGHIRVDGSITANSNNGTAGGDIYIGRDKDTNVLAAVGDVSSATLESRGGFVETSGDWLATYGTKVKAKDWLLDPYNIKIVDAASGTPYSDPNETGGSYSYTPGVASNILNIDIQNSLNDGTNVTIATGGVGSGNDAGNITVNAEISKTLGGDAKLTLDAYNGIFLNKKILSSNNGKLDVTLRAGGNYAANSAGIYIAGSYAGIDTNGKVVIDSTTKYTGVWDFTKSALAMSNGSIIKGSDVDIKLKVDTPTGSNGYRVYGAFLQNGVTLAATTGNFAMDSKITNGANSGMTLALPAFDSSAILLGSSYGRAVDVSAKGNVSFTADWSGNVGTGGGIIMVDTKISAGGNILVDSKVSKSGINAIGVGNGGGSTLVAGDEHGFSAQSTNSDVTFKANQGSISLGNLTAPIKGRNITIDNTGGTVSVDSVTGLATLTKGSGVSTDTLRSGVTISSNTGIAGILAKGNVNIAGKSTANAQQSGVKIDWPYVAPPNSVPAATTSITGKNVDIYGSSKEHNGIYSVASVEATSGNVKLVGESTGISSYTTAVSFRNQITASNNIEITGTNTNTGTGQAAVYLNNAVTATSGTINVIADTKGQNTNALRLDGATLNTTAGKDITLTADTLYLSQTGRVGGIDAGTTGTVTLQNKSAGVKIDIGGYDVANTSHMDRTLALTTTELGLVKAKNIVIGRTDSLASGDIKVSVSTTTAPSTGNITLQTGGKIEVDQALSAANDKNLTLKAIGDINVNNTISQGGAGNIVLAAGFGKGAGDGSGGQVKGTGDVNNGTGAAKTYIYTGTVADSAKMSELNSTAFSQLNLSSVGSANTQNAQSNTATDLANTISGGANMQVMYREKITVNLNATGNALNNATKTYGDVGNGSGDLSTAIKSANTEKTLNWEAPNGTKFNLSAGAFIDTLKFSGTPTYSASNKLNADSSAYGTTSTTYTASGLPTLKIDPKKLSINPGTVPNKTADGTATAKVNPGSLDGVVGNETLGVVATGTFNDANAGVNKPVKAFYTLQDGSGKASNYILELGTPTNPDTRMTGTILAAVNPVTSSAQVNNNTGSFSRVRTVSGFGGAGAATGVLDDKAVTESREVCSDVFPENCECQPSVIPSIEICFAPKSVAATKEEK